MSGIFVLPKDVLRYLISNYLAGEAITIFLVCHDFYKLFDDYAKDELLKKYCTLQVRNENDWRNICDVCGVNNVLPKFKITNSKKAKKKVETKINKHIQHWHTYEKLKQLKEENDRCDLCTQLRCL